MFPTSRLGKIFLSRGRRRTNRRAPTRPQVEALEVRLTPAGADPKVYVQANTPVAPGSAVTVPVWLDTLGEDLTGNNAITAFTLAINYDPTLLTYASASNGVLMNTPGTTWSIQPNPDTPGQLILVGFETSGAAVAFSPGVDTVETMINITFTSFASDKGTALIDLAHDVQTKPTQLNGVGNVLLTLSPAPQNNPPPPNTVSDPDDGLVTFQIVANQPPFDKVPVAMVIPQVLFNPAAVTGLHTGTPNFVLFSPTGGVNSVSDAITVSDPDAGSNPVKTTLTVLHGSLTLSGTTNLTVTGNGTATVVVTGAISDINTALNNLKYQPAAGFAGTDTLTVSTNDQGNSGFGGPQTDSHSTTITVVGLYISEIMLAPSPVVITSATTDGSTVTIITATPHGFTSGQPVIISGVSDPGYNGTFTNIQVVNATRFTYALNGLHFIANGGTAASTPNPTQYLEVFSTVPSYTIPSTVYLVGIEGDNDTGVNAANTPGLVQDIFRLGGFTTGSQGYLALIERPLNGSTNPYVNAGATTGDYFVNTATTQTGFGNGGTNSKYNNITNVHNGQATGTGARAGASAIEVQTEIEQGSESFLLLQAATAPAIGNNIDPNNNGTPAGTTYNSWNVFDSVGILDAVAGTSGNDRSYAAITFRSTSGNGTALATSVSTGTWTASYVGRIAKNTGWTGNDWLASQPTGGGGSYVLGAGVSTKFAGQALNHIGSPNYWAPQDTVVVNDGSSVQQSQVSELTVTFNEPVSISSLTGAFQVTDKQGNPLSINVTVTGGINNGNNTASNVTALLITFNADATHTLTYVSGHTDPFGNTVALNDGNYFLNSVAADITNNGVSLDGARNGTAGSNGHDEFWRLYGDTLGRRLVDWTDNKTFVGTYGSNFSNGDPNYLWYLDYDGSYVIDSLDRTQFVQRRGTKLSP